MTQLPFFAELTVNETIQRYPDTLAVFTAFGIDTCCGGAVRISDVVKRHGIDPKQLFAEMTRAIGPDASHQRDHTTAPA